MKTIYRKMFAASLLVTGFFMLSGCAKKISFLNSAVAPAARGEVHVKKDKNHNYVISLSIQDLAEVSRLTPARNTYVVWMITEHDKTKNIGQIKSGTGMISKRLKASFETVSSFRPTQIFLTAEDQADVQFPGTQVVLTTGDF